MEEVKEQPQVVGAQPLTGKLGRPKLMLSDEERKLRRRLMHNEAQRRSHKKMIRTEKNKRKGKIGKKKRGLVLKGGLNHRQWTCCDNRLRKKDNLRSKKQGSS
jgi:hypothetical protein